MFNNGYKKEALEKLDDQVKKYNQEYLLTMASITELHNDKQWAVKILKAYEKYINSISNKPKKIDKITSEVSVRRKDFESEVNGICIEGQNVDSNVKGGVGTGVVVGTGVAAFGPTAAMAVATTFGTASTGTAIATLSGAAASNAALAWLGGGALADGGGGMAAGEALLAMAGPVGWAIGATAVIGGGLWASSKNKKVAKEAEEKTKEIIKSKHELKQINEKVKHEDKLLLAIIKGMRGDLKYLISLPERDYKKLTDEQLDILKSVINSAESLSKRIGVKLS